jgi:hypothetical protein
MKYSISIMEKLLLLAFCFIICFGRPSPLHGEEKVFAGWILHMFLSGQLKEYTPRGGMTECLKVKRKIIRSQGHLYVGARWECRQGKLVLRKYKGGNLEETWLPIQHLGNK